MDHVSPESTWIFYIFLLEIIQFIIVLPIVFYVYIFPNIQKRMDEKIYYSDPYVFLWMPFNLSAVIVYQYISWKIWGHPGKGLGKAFYKKYKSTSNFVLAKSDYDVRNAPLFEIFLAIWTELNMWTFLIIAFGFWIYQLFS